MAPQIDRDVCTGCNLCHEVCPDGIIAPGPALPPETAQYCAECGHCAAICPVEAVSLASGEMTQPIPAGAPVAPGAAMALLRGRRSVRLYKPEPVSSQHLEAILAAAATYPSSANMRPVRASVITDAARIAAIRRATESLCRTVLRVLRLPGAGLLGRFVGYPPAEVRRLVHGLRHIAEGEGDHLFHGATALLVFSVPKAYRESVGDAWLAAENAVIYAETIPVGTCYNGVLTLAASVKPGLKAMLGVPRGDKLVAALTLGYPRAPFRRLPPWPPMPTTWL